MRFGILGAARIAPNALIGPARRVEGAVVTAVAARDRARAQAFASRHGIPRVLESYQALVEDPEIDAIYVPLPNSLHHDWTLRALEAGKDVLCEKPLAANADEAESMARMAAKHARILVEAFHYRYHPLATRMKAIVDSGELGPLRSVEAHFCVPMPFFRDIRYRYDMAGGATMDLGCYAIHLLRFVTGAEPTVANAAARTVEPQVDRWTAARLAFPDGCSGHFTASLLSAVLLRVSLRIRGERGELTVLNPWLPHLYHRMVVRTDRRVLVERVRGETSYTHQLRAFVRAVSDRVSLPTDPRDAILNMRVIDAVYERTGLGKRGS